MNFGWLGGAGLFLGLFGANLMMNHRNWRQRVLMGCVTGGLLAISLWNAFHG